MSFSKSSFLFLFWLGFCAAGPTSLLLAANQELSCEGNRSTEISIEGMISSPNGPVTGANTYLFREQLITESISNQDGTFQFSLDSDQPAKILVVANGMISQVLVLDPKKESKLAVQLEVEKTPLKGRIIDNEGMNVTNAKLRILSQRQKNGTIDIPAGLKNDHLESSTNDQGMFQFDGIDASMVGTINVSGPGIVTSSLTSESFDEKIVLVAQPARIVQGTVIDRISRQPISHVVVSQSSGGSQTEVDESGAFELKGLPAFQPLLLLANPIGERPYLANAISVPPENGFDPVAVEFELEPGVWIKCNVKDFGTGGPATAEAFYFPTPENEDFQSFIETFQARGFGPSSSTNPSGDAKIVAIPGPGVIAIVAQGFPPNESVNKLTDQQRAMLLGVTGRNELTAVAWIEPKDLKDEIELSFLVSKGRVIEFALTNNQIDSTDPLIVHRAASRTSYAQSVLGPKFVAEQFQPGETRQILIHATHKNLAAVLDVKAEAQSPVHVVLQPTGSMNGQAVNRNGDPQPGLMIKFEIPTDVGYQEIATPVFTDANGRFEKSSLIAELEYRVAAVRRTNSQQQMMEKSPVADSQWYVAENLRINSGEEVDLGSIVPGAARQPAPQRRLRKDTVASSTALPPIISGVVTNAAGEPIADAMISFNTWPNRSGDLIQDQELKPIVLAQSRSDSNGNFQMTIDGSLKGKLITSDSSRRELNAAIVVVGKELGTFQIPLREISDPQNVEIRMDREMVVRGKVSLKGAAVTKKFRLTAGSRMRVYDADSINQIIAGLQQGISLKTLSQKFQHRLILDPLIGGIPLSWKTSSSGSFFVRHIPLNAIFELHAIEGSGQQKTITVVSRPIRGFEFRPTDDSSETMPLQGSRITLEFGPPTGEK